LRPSAPKPFGPAEPLAALFAEDAEWRGISHGHLPTVKWRIFKARETVATALARADLTGDERRLPPQSD
jgi:hypothetical protein